MGTVVYTRRATAMRSAGVTRAWTGELDTGVGDAFGEGVEALAVGLAWLVPELAGPQAETMAKLAHAAMNGVYPCLMPIPTELSRRELPWGHYPLSHTGSPKRGATRVVRLMDRPVTLTRFALRKLRPTMLFPAWPWAELRR
jgi:hypothetical protein